MTNDEQVRKLNNQIDSIFKEYETEYYNLANRAEKLYDDKQFLNKEYEALDAKTGLTALYERLAKLSEEKQAK